MSRVFKVANAIANMAKEIIAPVSKKRRAHLKKGRAKNNSRLFAAIAANKKAVACIAVAFVLVPTAAAVAGSMKNDGNKEEQIQASASTQQNETTLQASTANTADTVGDVKGADTAAQSTQPANTPADKPVIADISEEEKKTDDTAAADTKTDGNKDQADIQTAGTTYKELVPESTNEANKELQERLMELDYMDTDEPTAYYGRVTQEAVGFFQRKHELAEDGVAGEETQKLLFSDEAKPYSVTEKAEGADVERIQTRLQNLGYDVDVTGYFGSDTTKAVEYFQRMNGLTDDGSVGHDTKEMLYSDEATPSLAYIEEQEQKEKEKEQEKESSSKKSSDSSSKKSNSSSSSSSSSSSGSGSGSSKAASSTSYTADPGNVEAFIAVAMDQVGKPYVRGGKGPSNFDCSGFVYYALNQSGNSIGYMTSGGWAGCGYPTVGSVDALQRGDIICITGHVAIYLGNGTMIDASSGQGQIVVRDVGPWARRNFICGKRPL